MTQTTWVVQLEEDPETGDLIMPIPVEALSQCGWDVGDTLLWDITSDGEISLTKKKE